MSKGPSYAILGRGRWAQKMRGILSGEDRRVVEIGETRQAPGESDAAYRRRLAEVMRASGAHIAWLCVLPGPHVALMSEAALDANLHVVVEKPWLCSVPATQALVSRAKSLQRIVGVHYEYCLLEEVEKLRTVFHPGLGFIFGGNFFLNRRDHTGMHPLDNLGSHILSICVYAVPQSALQRIRCGYELPDERCVWLERRKTRVAFIDLLAHKQPIIQRFVRQFEAAMNSADFAFDLAFAQAVSDEVEALK